MDKAKCVIFFGSIISTETCVRYSDHRIPFVEIHPNIFALQDVDHRMAILTHCGLVTPYGDIDQSQHWLLPVPMLIYNQWGSLALIKTNFTASDQDIIS